MQRSVNHDLVAQLLEDESLSYREIGRRAGCSDWTVRRIARELASDSRPMKFQSYENNENDEPLGFAGWGVLAGIASLFIGAVWLWKRGMPPPDV
jgi:hypothetical protein